MCIATAMQALIAQQHGEQRQDEGSLCAFISAQRPQKLTLPFEGNKKGKRNLFLGGVF